MKIKILDKTPRKIVHFPREEEHDSVKGDNIEDICELFETPLVGAFNWDYTAADNRIMRLYELGKELNWNGSIDLDWDRPLPELHSIPGAQMWNDYPPFAKLSDEKKQDFFKHRHAWSLSQFLHGEQGALLVASQLVSCAPTYNAKLYAASQTFDEARHVEVFNRYIQERVGFSYPIGNGLKSLIDKILADSRWDLKFIGMQIIIEGLALAAFQSMKDTTKDPVLRDLVTYVLRDEARHVTFGVNYLEELVQTLSEEEREERALFAYEACMVSRDRLTSRDVYTRMGWDADEAVAYVAENGLQQEFRNLLFTRVIPNLSRIGLLTDKVRPLYDKVGLLDYEHADSDYEIDWAELSKPLELDSQESV